MTHAFSHTISFLLTAALAAQASKMSVSIEEASYLFEFKGEFDEAVSILEKVSDEGDAEDKTRANFLLGKIHDISGNAYSAEFYYSQALMNPENDADAYWLSERLAALNPAPEKLVKSVKRMPSPVTRIFDGQTPALLLENHQLLRLYDDKFVSIPTFFPENVNILAVSRTGTWFTLPGDYTLHFQPVQAKRNMRNYTLDSPVTSIFPLSGNQALVTTDGSLIFIGNEGIRFSIDNRYRGCTPLGTFAPTNQIVLNCPDNALHLIQEEDGTEGTVISLLDAIGKVILTPDGILLSAGNAVWYYQPQRQVTPVWHRTGNVIEDISKFGDNFALLESTGMLLLLNAETGKVLSRYQTGAELIYPIARGELGVFTQEGEMTVLDTLLSPLWKFHFGQGLARGPIKGDGSLFIPLEDGSFTEISSLHYGKKPILSQTIAERALKAVEKDDWKSAIPRIDSVRAMEPGNATAWYMFALMKEKQKVPAREQKFLWSEAMRYSIGNPKISNYILSHYGRLVGSRYVHSLNLSPRTRYPRLFGNGKNLYIVDVAARTVQNINPETGDVRWLKETGKLDDSPVIASDATTLAIAEGFRINISSLSREGAPQTVELPGKPFQMQSGNGSLLISTWNGFLVKLIKPDFRIAWSRKVFTVPFYFAESDPSIYAASLDGEVQSLWSASGQIREHGPNLGASLVTAQADDTYLAIATDDNEIHLYTTASGYKDAQTIETKAGVVSLQWIQMGSGHYLLAGLSNQQIALFRPGADDPVWTYAGKNSIFVSPVVSHSFAWIDQGNEIAGISLATGKAEKRISAPGGAGTPFLLNGILFYVSPTRLLYAFPM
jgi:tetratricopeptide (TPR) repeat protein